MGLDIECERDPAAWNELVGRAPHGTPFHRYECLTAAARHTNTELAPLVGYNGQEPVGVFPLSTRSLGPVTVAFSPPPRLKLTYGGPLLLDQGGLKQRKAERRNRQLVEGCLTWLDEACGPVYTHVRTGTRYDDARPFLWASFDVTPGYTHVVDISPPEDDLLARFSSDARKNVTDPEPDVLIREEGVGGIERIIDQVRARHAEQGRAYDLPAAFPVDLYRDLPDGVVRPYVCRVDGSFAGGIVALESGDTVYRWQGGATPTVDVPVNDLVDWRIIRDARDRGLGRYDLVGAGDPGISQYKAKFAPSVEPYFQMTRSTLAAELVREVYGRVR
ncbi:GNAT family N-acetyltransferase [Haloglomus litoreum]|uniref:GNAT family N-acetyltransferase n=1 Tax=Haloglomus litoreum TaxID=3034026 RepID=UPI0023E7AE20|nr:GNAT family N-acetyltransferase [Haloglomus sp. DT116]